MALLLYDLCGRDPDLRFSPYCWRAKLALAHKGLAFETVPVPFTRIRDVTEGARTVPVLDDSGRIVRDSFAIALHLDASRPDSLPLFGHEGVVAAARFLEAWTLAALHPLISRMILKDIHDALAPDDQAYFRESREARFGRTLEDVQEGVAALAETFAAALAPVRRTLQHVEWLGGAAPLFPDYVVFGSLQWLAAVHGRLPLEPDDPVARWFENCLDLHGGLGRRAKRAA